MELRSVGTPYVCTFVLKDKNPKQMQYICGIFKIQYSKEVLSLPMICSKHIPSLFPFLEVLITF